MFVDLPPVSLVPETSGVYACADLTMLAIRHGMTPVKSVEQMLRNLSIYSDRIIAVINCDPVVREYSKHSYYSRNRPYLQETPKKVG